MTRLSDHAVLQRVEDRLVLFDESSGAEYVFPLVEADHLIRALVHLRHGEGVYRALVADMPDGSQTLVTLWGDGSAEIATRPEANTQVRWSPPTALAEAP